MSDTKAQVAAIDARVARLGTRHAAALGKLLKRPPTAGVKMTWSERRRLGRYSKASKALLAEVRASADELSVLIDHVLDEVRPSLTEAERAQIRKTLIPEWAKPLHERIVGKMGEQK